MARKFFNVFLSILILLALSFPSLRRFSFIFLCMFDFFMFTFILFFSISFFFFSLLILFFLLMSIFFLSLFHFLMSFVFLYLCSFSFFAFEIQLLFMLSKQKMFSKQRRYLVQMKWNTCRKLFPENESHQGRCHRTKMS